jgi:transcriptional regulator with GAF, ATPase, and Fis domain
MEPHGVTRVLSEIADIASETLELHEVFDRVAASVRRLIPFDKICVVRVVDGDRVVLHAKAGVSEDDRVEDGHPGKFEKPLTDWSPRWRPRPGPCPRIEDAKAELDPAFPFDHEVLDRGLRSGLWGPFRNGSTFVGGIWLCSYSAHRFNDEHQALLRPVAALIGSAVSHWKIWEAESGRRERLDRLDEALDQLAATLDVRDLVQKVHEMVQSVLPHDLIALTELDENPRNVRVVTWAGQSDVVIPTEPVALTPEEVERRLLPVEVLSDIPAELPTTTERNRLIRESGMRSFLRVPIRLWGQVRGSLSFLHREPSRFGPGDAEVARRLADRIALVLSHRRLAEEERVAEEQKERAERLAATVEALARELDSRGRDRIVGISPSWRETLLRAGQVAPTETTVLLTGESGTGKEVVSGLIHQGSPRAGKPFVAVNCAALPEQLLESELFGHERGAFTGAISTKIGRIEQAAGGTLFLDEIAEMTPAVQAKLLRVLEEREFQRLGGTRTLKADVRVIAATNRDLSAEIARHRFREDLYYRLNVFEITLAPLRERPEDILPLAEMFLEELGPTLKRPAAGISRDARERLLAYSWPGNVRELRNAIERAIILCDGGLVTSEHLPSPSAVLENGARPAGLAFPESLPGVERNLVESALKQSGNNKARAARRLGITRSQLYSRLQKYRIVL